MKVYQEDDLVICGYIPKENNIIDLIMGRYLEGKLIRAGRVITGKYKREIIDYAKKHPSPPLFDQEEAIWMVPNLVGTVRYMMETKTGGLRQPVFVGIRDDKIGKDLM
jgi:bifunctional non-homologous end joining protein LigD/DNA ligase-1